MLPTGIGTGGTIRHREGAGGFRTADLRIRRHRLTVDVLLAGDELVPASEDAVRRGRGAKDVLRRSDNANVVDAHVTRRAIRGAEVSSVTHARDAVLARGTRVRAAAHVVVRRRGARSLADSAVADQILGPVAVGAEDALLPDLAEVGRLCHPARPSAVDIRLRIVLNAVVASGDVPGGADALQLPLVAADQAVGALVAVQGAGIVELLLPVLVVLPAAGEEGEHRHDGDGEQLRELLHDRSFSPL